MRVAAACDARDTTRAGADDHHHQRSDMSNIDAMIEKYVGSWNEKDPAVRRRVIDEIWALDGVYRNAATEFRGRAGLEDAVTQAYEAFTANGFMFKLATV